MGLAGPQPGGDVVGRLQGPFKRVPALVSLTQGAAQFHLRHHLTGQGLERRLLKLSQTFRPGLGVQNAQGAQGQAAGRLQQPPRIEAQPRLLMNQRIAVEPGVPCRIRHHQPVLIQQGVGAEGGRQRRLAHAQPDLGLEPLPSGVDQIDDRDRGLADAGDQGHHVVKGGLARRIKNAVVSQAARRSDSSTVQVQQWGRSNRRPFEAVSEISSFNARPAQALH